MLPSACISRGPGSSCWRLRIAFIPRAHLPALACLPWPTCLPWPACPPLQWLFVFTIMLLLLARLDNLLMWRGEGALDMQARRSPTLWLAGETGTGSACGSIHRSGC